MAAGIALLVPGCGAQQPPIGATQWLGKSRSEIVQALGEPTSAVPLEDTGGEMLIYARRGEKHYVFETAPGGRAAKAVEVK